LGSRDGLEYSEAVFDRVAESLASAVAARVHGMVALYLFGSRARGDGAADSDIDLAVLAQNRLDPIERWKLQEDLAALAHRNVDLVDLRQASTVMRVEVLRDAILLLDAQPSARNAFEAFALSAYARLNEERREILNDIRARGRVHG
jgi:predicted nucleotidyltransferase